MSWNDFLGGVAQGLPAGVDAFSKISSTLKDKQAQETKQKEAFISGADFKRQLQAAGIDTSKLDFQDAEQIPWNQAKETLDHVTTQMQNAQNQHEYTVSAGRTKSGRQVFNRTKAPAGEPIQIYSDWTPAKGKMLKAPTYDAQGQMLTPGEFEDEQILPQIKTLPAEQAVKLAQGNVIQEQVANVRNTFRPEYVGPIQARLGKLGQIMDIPEIGLEATADRATFYSNLASIKNQLLNMRSGAQINENEYGRLVAELPNESSSDVDFEARLTNFENVFNQIMTTKNKAFEQAGYTQPDVVTNSRNLTPSVGQVRPNSPLGAGNDMVNEYNRQQATPSTILQKLRAQRGGKK